MIKKAKKRLYSINSSDLESNNIFEQDNINKYLLKLHNRFVIVPVDKANNNFAIICKNFYIQILKQELGINNANDIKGNAVYEPCTISIEDFFIEQELANKELGIDLEEDNRYIPSLYWTSKQHKNPYKFRFIAGASRCTNKTISIELALALKCIKTHFKNYCKVIKNNNGLNYYWSIDNSTEFLDKVSSIDKADSIETFDFSTLYTNLPLENIYNNLECLIIKMFANSGSNSMLINADRRKAFWSQSSTRSGYREYTLDRLLDALKFVLYNSYVKFGGTFFKQIQGIPMGGNASPFIADLYLAWDEYCFMEKLAKSQTLEDKILAKLLSNNSRYIDDIAVVNFLGFGSISKLIYNPTLILEGSDYGYHFDTFLDLLIRIHNNKWIIGIYHKVDDFDFDVINFVFPTSNIESATAYNSFYSQLIRFYRLCNNFADFSVRVDMLRDKLCSRGFNTKKLHKFFLKFCRNHPACLVKFGYTDTEKLWSNTFISKPLVYNVQNTSEIQKRIQPCSILLKNINDN